MHSFSLSTGFIFCVAMIGCGGNGGGTTTAAGSGGGTGNLATGGSAATGGVTGRGGDSATGGGTGGNGNGGSQADAGGKDVAAISTKADASMTKADQAISIGDGGVTVGPCPSFTPCGGDIVGTWHMRYQCLPSPSSLPVCVIDLPGRDLSNLEATFTFTSSGTVTYSQSGTSKQTIRYSAGCLGGDAGVDLTCSRFQQLALQSWQAQSDAGAMPFNMDKFECSADSTQACVCNETFSYPSQLAQTGSYTTAGNQVTIGSLTVAPMPDAGAVDAAPDQPMDYCVSADTLTLKPDSASDALMVFLR